MPPSTEYNKMMMMIDEKHEIGHPTQYVILPTFRFRSMAWREVTP